MNAADRRMAADIAATLLGAADEAAAHGFAADGSPGLWTVAIPPEFGRNPAVMAEVGRRVLAVAQRRELRTLIDSTGEG